MFKPQLRVWFFISLVSLWLGMPPSFATKLPGDLRGALQAEFPGGKIRLDGSIETTKGEIFIPLIPAKTKNNGKLAVQTFPSKQEPNLLVFGNAWSYLRVLPKGRLRVVRMPADMPEKFRNFLLTGRLPEDLIVPDHFVLPKSLAPIVGDLAIEIVNDDLYTHPEFGAVRAAKKLPPKPVGPIHGSILALSPNSGKIALLDHESLKKLTEFPLEGTPSGITYANGIVYISDVSKNKILRLDPSRGQFIGQIDLPANAKPRGLATLPNSKLFYVTESGLNDIAVYEPAGDKSSADKLLVRTKTAVGPSYVAVSPNGQLLLALNTPCGKLTFISALTQKLLNTINVGTMPNGIVIDSESERAYISNRISNTVSVVDLLNRKVIETLKTGNGPTGLAFDEEEGKLFVANAKDNTICVFDLKTNKRLDDIKLPLDLDFPGGITLMPDRKHLLISSESTQNVGLIDTKTMLVEKQPDIGQTSDRFLFVPSEN